MRTDHDSLKFLLDQHLSTIPQHTWVSKLLGFDFTVEFRPGKQNAAADALAQRDEEDVLAYALSLPDFELYAQFRLEAASLPEIITKRAEIEGGTAAASWSLVDDLVLFQGRIFVPSSCSLWPQILAVAHEAGHEGVQKTLKSSSA